MKTHMWTFLTTTSYLFVTIPASPPPSLSLCISFRLNKTFPCHGILKVVYMCMSNAMNMDVTSFFGAWPPACPLAGTPTPTTTTTPPPKAQDTTSQWAQRAQETQPHPRWTHTHTHTQMHTHTHTYTHTPRNGAHNHGHTCTHISTRMHAYTETHPTLSCSRFFLRCLSPLTFHNVLYIKIKEEGGKWKPEDGGEGGFWFIIHVCDTSNERVASGLCLCMWESGACRHVRTCNRAHVGRYVCMWNWGYV